MFNRRSFFRKTSLAVGALTVPQLLKSQPQEIASGTILYGKNPYQALRSQLLIPKDRIYLNTGSLGPSPLPVLEVVFETMKQLEANPVVENWGSLGKKMEEVRSTVGSFINADGEDIILTRNTTEGLSLIAQALKLETGDEIITSTREHGGGEVGLEFICERDGATLRKIELPMPAMSAKQIIQSISEKISNRTKLIMLSHVNTVTGLRMPFEMISEITKSRGILLVADGAQSAGMLKIDVQKLGVDAYTSSGHKWILGPKETGFLYLSKEFQTSINTVFTSGGFQSYSRSTGTRNVATLIGLGQTIKLHNRIGSNRIEAKCGSLRNYCLEKLRNLKNIRILSPSEESLSSGIVSIELLRVRNSEVAEYLRSKDIIVKVLPGINALRFSCHIFVSESNILRMVTELQKLV